MTIESSIPEALDDVHRLYCVMHEAYIISVKQRDGFAAHKKAKREYIEGLERLVAMIDVLPDDHPLRIVFVGAGYLQQSNNS